MHTESAYVLYNAQMDLSRETFQYRRASAAPHISSLLEGRLPHSVREMSRSDRGRPPPSAGGTRKARDGGREEISACFSPPVKCFAFDSLALSRYPILFTAWSAEQNRPLRPQMFPFSATGGGHICCPSEGGGNGGRFVNRPYNRRERS